MFLCKIVIIHLIRVVQPLHLTHTCMDVLLQCFLRTSTLRSWLRSESRTLSDAADVFGSLMLSALISETSSHSYDPNEIQRVIELRINIYNFIMLMNNKATVSLLLRSDTSIASALFTAIWSAGRPSQSSLAKARQHLLRRRAHQGPFQQVSKTFKDELCKK